MVESTHLFNIIFRVIDKATSSLGTIHSNLNKLNTPLKSITDAISHSQTRLGGWVNPIDAVTSKFKVVSTETLTAGLLIQNNIKSITDAISHSQARLGGWVDPIDAVNAHLKPTTQKMITFDDLIKKTTKNMGKMGESFGGFNKKMLQLGLGMTFFMWGVRMQLERTLRSMFTVFEEANGQFGAMNQGFNIIRANLASISIAFWDAFSQSPLFEFLLNAVEALTNWFLNLDDSTREWYSISFLAIAGIITLLSILGQALLAINTIMEMNPTVAGFTIIALALVGLSVYFAIHSKEIKTSWQNLMDDFKANPNLSTFDKIKLALINLKIIGLEMAPGIMAIFGGIWGAVLGEGVLGAGIGIIAGSAAGLAMQKMQNLAGLKAERNALERQIKGVTDKGFTGSWKTTQDNVLGGDRSSSLVTPQGSMMDYIGQGGGDISSALEQLPTQFNESIKNMGQSLVDIGQITNSALSAIPTQFNESIATNLSKIPIMINSTAMPVKLNTTVPLDIFNPQDKDKIQKMEEQKQTMIKESNNQIGVLNGILAEVNKLPKNLNVTVNVFSSNSGSPYS